MKTATTMFSAAMLGIVLMFGGAAAAFAAPIEAGQGGLVATIADIVQAKYQEAVADAAEDAAEAAWAAKVSAPDAAEEAADAAESAREAEHARALYEQYGNDTTEVVVYDDDWDDIDIAADGTIVYVDDDADEDDWYDDADDDDADDVDDYDDADNLDDDDYDDDGSDYDDDDDDDDDDEEEDDD